MIFNNYILYNLTFTVVRLINANRQERSDIDITKIRCARQYL